MPFHKGVFLFCLLCTVVSCGTSSSTDTTTTTDSTGLRFVSTGDFESSAATALSSPLKTTTRTCDDVTTDDQFNPDIADGLDCDGDGGVVAHITPTQYLLAVKRVTLFSDDATTAELDLLEDTGTLANSEVINFTPDSTSETVVTVNPTDLTAGTYDGIKVEIYYFQMTFPIGGVTRNVRIYMSDDDFTSEAANRIGLGPHHQGDITFIDDDGTTELGWIDFNWNDTLASSHGDDQNGAAGDDPETGHARGFFGDADFWNTTLLTQGTTQDVYIYQVRFDESFTIPDPSTITDLTMITATFSIADTFFYEDFDPVGSGFSGGTGSDAVNPDGGWAPLEPTASVTVQ